MYIQVTLFMPDDKAFGTVDPLTLGRNVNQLLFKAHVIDGISMSQAWNNNTQLTTLLPNNSLSLAHNGSNWFGKILSRVTYRIS
jgi:hypothetical protein